MAELTRVPPRAGSAAGESPPRRARAPATSPARDHRLARLPRFRTEQEKRRDRWTVAFLVASLLVLLALLFTL